LNPRPKVWSSLKPLLEKSFPEHVAQTGHILYNQEARCLHQEAMKGSILRWAKRWDLKAKIHFCF